MEVDDDFGIRKKANGKALSGKRSAMNPESVEGDANVEMEDANKRSVEKIDDYDHPSPTRRRGRQSASTAAEDDECGGVWGDLDKPFVGFKMASMTLRKIQKYSPDKINQPADTNTEMAADGSPAKPKWMTATTGVEAKKSEDKAMASDDEAAAAEEEAKKQAASSDLEELQDLLDFIEAYKDAVAYFDQNGSRQIYMKFRDEEDSRERILHNIVHFFIALHLPQSDVAN